MKNTPVKSYNKQWMKIPHSNKEETEMTQIIIAGIVGVIIGVGIMWVMA